MVEGLSDSRQPAKSAEMQDLCIDSKDRPNVLRIAPIKEKMDILTILSAKLPLSEQRSVGDVETGSKD